MIKHDSQGFLLGDKANELNTLDLLRAIKDEIAGLRSDLPSTVAMPVRGGPPVVVTVKSDAPIAMPSSSSESAPSATVMAPRSSGLSASATPTTVAEKQGVGSATGDTITNITNNSVANAGDANTRSSVTDASKESTAISTSRVQVATPAAGHSTPIEVNSSSPVGAPKALEVGTPSVAVAAPSTPNSTSTVAPVPVAAGHKVSNAAGDTNTSTATSSMVRADNKNYASSAGGDSTASTVAPTATTNNAGRPAGERDSKGRFVAVPSSGQAGSESSTTEKQAFKSVISDVGDRITGALGESPINENTDPSIKAFNEVAKPLQRGFGKIFNRKEDKTDVRWYRRFWRNMRDSKKTDKKQHKEQIKILEDIEKKGNGKSEGGLLGVMQRVIKAILTLIKSLLSLKLLDVLRKLPTAIGGGGRGKPGGKTQGPSTDKSVGKGAGRIGGGLKGVFRRIPVIGALLAAGSAAIGVRDSEGDKSTTRKEKDANTGRAVGKGAGALSGVMAGGAAGAAVGSVVPVVGTVIGGFVGAVVGAWMGESAGGIIGAQFGEWVGELRSSQFIKTIADTWDDMTTFTGHLWGQASDAVTERWGETITKVGEQISAAWSDVSERITAIWNGAVDGMKSGWDKVTSKMAGFWDSIADTAKKANDWIKDKTGVDVGGGIASASEAVSSAVSSATETVTEAATSAWDFTKNRITEAVKTAGEATGITAVVDAVKRSAEYTASRSDNKTALESQMIKAGITNVNEQASFMAQMDHESAGFTRMEENLNYSPEQFLKVFGSRAGITTEQEAAAVISQGKEAQAEVMYGGKWGAKNLGNTEKGDGHAFRGRGYTQLTGRSNYDQASKALGIDLINNPDLASEPETAAKIATWYWQSRSGLSEAGKAGDIEGVTERINGGFNGLDDRKAKTAMYMQEYRSRSASELVANAGQGMAGTTVAGANEAVRPPMLNVAAARVTTASAAGVVRTPALTSVPSVPAVSESPAVTVPLATGSRDRSGKEAAKREDVSRDVSDRRIAHVVTGAHSSLG